MEQFIVGLVFAVILYSLVNGVIFVINRVVQGQERIQGVVLVANAETVAKYVPGSITTTQQGTRIDATQAVRKLFQDDTIQRRIGKWAANGKLFTSIDTASAAATISRDDAAMRAGFRLIQAGATEDQVVRENFYIVPSTGTDTQYTAYVVVVGHIPRPMPFFLLPG